MEFYVDAVANSRPASKLEVRLAALGQQPEQPRHATDRSKPAEPQNAVLVHLQLRGTVCLHVVADSTQLWRQPRDFGEGWAVKTRIRLNRQGGVFTLRVLAKGGI